MRRKVYVLNDISLICFALSSTSLLLIPFVKTENGLTKTAYLIAGVFWGGLLLGIAFQIAAAVKSKQLKRKSPKKARRALIPVLVLGVTLIIIMCIGNKSVMLLSLNLALLFMSIEVYIYLRRRYGI